jgi:hypothetical protein
MENLILVPSDAVEDGAAAKSRGYRVVSPRLELEGWSELIKTVDAPHDFFGLSKVLRAHVVTCQISSEVDQVWITCFHGGTSVRELLYSSDDGWSITSGDPLEFENAGRMARWLRVPLLLASSDGYDLLNDFLGVDAPESERLSEATAGDGPVQRTPSPAPIEDSPELASLVTNVGARGKPRPAPKTKKKPPGKKASNAKAPKKTSSAKPARKKTSRAKPPRKKASSTRSPRKKASSARARR